MGGTEKSGEKAKREKKRQYGEKANAHGLEMSCLKLDWEVFADHSGKEMQ